MTSFKDYYESVQKTFDYRIKSLYEIDDASMDIIEKAIDKYRPTKVGKPKKMMFQTTPLGFTGVKNAEIFYVDITLSVPTTDSLLQYDLRTSFGLSPDSGIVMVTGNGDDPTEEQEETLEAEAKEDKKEPLLTSPMDDGGIVAADHFGNEATSRFLDYVKKTESTRKHGSIHVDAPHPITKWAQQPKPDADLVNTEDFDKGHTPKKVKAPTLAGFKGQKRLPVPKDM